MSDRKRYDLPFDTDNPSEQALWSALGDLPREEPQPQLNRNFYRRLEQASAVGPAARLRSWLGISGNGGWVTAAVCVLVGIAIGQLWNITLPGETNRLDALEQNVALLNRELILDRLQDSSASQRLRAVIDAAYLAGDDIEIMQALMTRASEDRVDSVRTAAIDALGPSLTTTVIGDELMNLLERTESPLVQLSVVDVVLRNGTTEQLAQVQSLANDGRLHPDVIAHVRNSLGDIS
ncbi:MAG: hypothetical protein OEM63_12335, partial [Gammaproteobacteria bacterium]|nr:hypothetical protein [Gammaproteobacteria bacterium]